MGDMHALQGDGEIAGHTCDVAGRVTLRVDVVKGLRLDGPVLFPLPDDLLRSPDLFRKQSEQRRWNWRKSMGSRNWKRPPPSP